MRIFLRFCVVGVVGFIVDAGVLAVAVYVFSVNAIPARALSFSCAVVVTWWLNRSWAFEVRSNSSLVQELMTYVAVQGLGLFANFATYTSLVLYAPHPISEPLVSLMVASIVALAA